MAASLYINVRLRGFEVSQHQSAANQQSPKCGDSLHKTANGLANGSVPDPFPPQRKTEKSGLATRDYKDIDLDLSLIIINLRIYI